MGICADVRGGKSQESGRTGRAWLRSCALARAGAYDVQVNDVNVFFFAAVIVASFAVSLAEAQFKPASSSHLSTVFYGAEISFAGIFSLELLINLFSSVEFWPFFSSRWNWFDILVVIVCWVGVGEPRWPALNLIRLIRVFRVIKLIKWNHSLNHLLSALTSSILPVLNSVILVFIFTSIFAVLATHLYGEDHTMVFMRSFLETFRHPCSPCCR